MFFYFLCISFFVLLYYVAERSGKQFLCVLALVPPVLLEGFRAPTIGTDMGTYVVPYFNTLRGVNNIADVPNIINHSDYGYLYLTYFCAKYLGSFNLFLSICAFAKLFPIYYVAYKLRRKIHSALFVFAYYLYYYVLGFSMMRQGLANSICILSIFFFLNRKYIKYLLCVILAYFLHNSAILMLYLPGVFIIRKMRYRYLISIAIPLVIMFNISTIMEFLMYSPLFTEGKIEHYMDSGVATEKTSLLLNMFYLAFGCLMLVKQKNKEITFILLSSVVYAICFLFLASYIEVAFRMSYYMLNVTMLMVLLIVKKERLYIYEGCVLWLYIIHFVIACTHGFNETIPYKSIFLDV